jgi:hypothetical protein
MRSAVVVCIMRSAVVVVSCGAQLWFVSCGAQFWFVSYGAQVSTFCCDQLTSCLCVRWLSRLSCPNSCDSQAGGEDIPWTSPQLKNLYGGKVYAVSSCCRPLASSLGNVLSMRQVTAQELTFIVTTESHTIWCVTWKERRTTLSHKYPRLVYLPNLSKLNSYAFHCAVMTCEISIFHWEAMTCSEYLLLDSH